MWGWKGAGAPFEGSRGRAGDCWAPKGSGCAIASGPAFQRWSKRGREPGRNAFDTFAMNAINFDVNIEAIDIIHINSIKNQTKYS